MDAIKHPLATEKAMRLMESENTLVFIVDRSASKTAIKTSVQGLFKAKVTHVRTHMLKGHKRAYVTFAQDTPAIDIATDLGVL